MKTDRLPVLVLIALFCGGFSGAGVFLFLNSNMSGAAAMTAAPVYLTETKETIIQENTALKNAVAAANGTVAALAIASKTGELIYGCGAALTSDGIIATPHSLFEPGAAAQMSVAGEKTSFEVLKRDKDLNLAIIKLETADLSTAGFYPLEELRLGERIFLVGVSSAGKSFANEGIVRDFDGETIATSISEKNEALGAPVFDIEGRILGIADIDKNGLVHVIPIWKIKEASGL